MLAPWRATLRIARRTALRHKGRSALILAMITLPVFAGTALEVARHTDTLSAHQRQVWQLGAADVKLYPPTHHTVAALRQQLPAGSRSAPYTTGTLDLRTATGQTRIDAVAADLGDSLFAGMYRLREGRYPRRSDEIAVSPRLAAERGLRVGGTAGLAEPDRTVRIVGLVRIPGDLSARRLLVPAAGGIEDANSAQSLLVALPPTARGPDPIQRLIAASHASGSVVAADTVQPGSDGTWINRYGVTLVVVAFAGTEIVLLAGSAFAVGARRSRRELGMIAATGGDAGHVGRVVLGGGLVLGLLGATLGVVLGALAAWAGRPVLQGVAGHELRPTVLPLGELIGLVGLAVLAALIAAAVPARWASRQPVLDALTGRAVHPGRSPRRIVVIGLGIALIGGGLAFLGATRPVRPELVAIGSAVGLLGFALCAPSLVAAVGRFAPVLPLSARLALRDAARHRNRTGAAVAAVTAAVAGSVAISLYNASTADRDSRGSTAGPIGQVTVASDQRALGALRPDDLVAMARSVRARSAVPLQRLDVSGPNAPQLSLSGVCDCSRELAAGGAAIIRATTGREPPAAALRTLAEGGVVVFQSSLRTGDTATVERSTGQRSQTVNLPATVVASRQQYFSMPSGVVSAATARRLGVVPGIDSIVLDTAAAPSATELEALNRVLGKALGSRSALVNASVATPSSAPATTSILLLAGASGFLTLAATGIAVGLSAAESREDMALLAAVGAAPRVRRVLSSTQAGLISVLGTVLGIPAGVIPAAGVIGTHADTLRFVVPWGPLGLGCLVAPLLVIVLSGLATRGNLPVLRRLG